MRYLSLLLITFITATNAAITSDIQINIIGIEEPEGFIRAVLFPKNKE